MHQCELDDDNVIVGEQVLSLAAVFHSDILNRH